jgi:hypothetical protein
MTDEEINQAIAKACGWRDLTIEGGSGFYKGFDNGAELRPDLPDYVNDLNAMHEAESVLQNQFLAMIEETYWRNLQWVKPHPIYATARQRAEAFLRTLGKWEEAK